MKTIVGSVVFSEKFDKKLKNRVFETGEMSRFSMPGLFRSGILPCPQLPEETVRLPKWMYPELKADPNFLEVASAEIVEGLVDSDTAPKWTSKFCDSLFSELDALSLETGFFQKSSGSLLFFEKGLAGVFVCRKSSEIDLWPVFEAWLQYGGDVLVLIFPLHPDPVRLFDLPDPGPARKFFTRWETRWQKSVRLPRGLGCHSPKSGTLTSSLENHLYRVGKADCQMFFHSKTGDGTITEDDLKKSRRLVEETGLRVIVHSPYFINLCNLKSWTVDLFREELEWLAEIGGHGVVVHVGKYTTMDPDEGLQRMRSALEELAHFATPECPVLLETPAGQGTELCCQFEELMEMLESVDPRVCLCIDSCHVFATGQDPVQYLSDALKRLPGRVRAVHLNDSQEACGSCKDRHAPFDQGLIGSSALAEVVDIARKHSLVCVREYDISQDH